MYITFSDLFGFIQINQIATDINKYKVIHAGPKIQSGGLKWGLAIVEYHGSLCILVIKPPQAEAPKARTTKINNEKKFLDKVIAVFMLLTICRHQLQLLDP